MEFYILGHDQYKQWDHFVDTSPQGSLFSKSVYLDALGIPYKIGALFKGEVIQGGIVLTKNEIRLYSNPLFAKYLGILIRHISGKYVNKINIEKKIIERIVSELKGIKSFDYTFHPRFQNWLPFYWNGFNQETRYTYKIYHIRNIDNVMSNVDSSIRNDLRKAEKNNIQIVSDIPLNDFYKINQLTYERQGGTIPYSFNFLNHYYHCLNEHNMIKLLAAVDENGQYQAVSGIVYDQECSYFLFNGINHNLPNLGANSLLVIKTIEYASQESEHFDFEGSMLKHVEKFYRSFGGVLTPYFAIWRRGLFNSGKRFAIRLYKKMKYGA